MPITKCRICGAAELQAVLSLGHTPLANSLLTAAQLDSPEATYPLEVVFCPTCTLVQITETVPPEVLFGNYLYFSSFSDTVLHNARTLVEQLVQRRHLDTTSLAGEIASNDGYLLKNYQTYGIPVLGIEPARNIAATAQANGIRTLNRFFDAYVGAELAAAGEQADVIHANNVLAHVADLHGVVSGLRQWLKAAGVAVIEAPYLKDTIDQTEFDQIYHEHLCYFSLTALKTLFADHALKIVDVEHLPIHGGSLRVYVTHADAPEAVQPSVAAWLDEEQEWGVARLDFYRNFGAKVAQLKTDLRNLLAGIKTAGHRIVVYGASAKGSTLLNYFGLGQETIDYVVDRSTVKQGLYTPGTHLQIVPPERLLADQPDYVLLLTWNFATEILEQQAEYRRRGGRFILPIPTLKVV
ncbi:MAG: class I SAM-dependent methyltransferase [Caldilinea sp.]